MGLIDSMFKISHAHAFLQLKQFNTNINYFMAITKKMFYSLITLVEDYM